MSDNGERPKVVPRYHYKCYIFLINLFNPLDIRI